MTAFRMNTVFDMQLEFSSRLLKEVFFEAVKTKHDSWLTQQYFTLRDDVKAGEYFESIAFNFLDGRSNFDFHPKGGPEGAKGTFVPRVLDRTTPFGLTTRMVGPSSAHGRSSESPVVASTPSRDTSPTRPQYKRVAAGQPDEASPPPFKRPKMELSLSPSSFPEQPQFTPTPQTYLPPPAKRCYYLAATLKAVEERILYIPSARMNALFDVFTLYGPVLFLFQAFSRQGSARHNMSHRGISAVKKILALCQEKYTEVEVVFVAIVPFGKNATLMVPQDSVFDEWRYFSLELELPQVENNEEHP
ncbi:hypothetical protein B0H13DRAFT_2340566 [Mycena leptocephala]|nr:hypothetical protein B0H13DRAFT_2340566 [Mycena leptocephala]